MLDPWEAKNGEERKHGSVKVREKVITGIRKAQDAAADMIDAWRKQTGPARAARQQVIMDAVQEERAERTRRAGVSKCVTAAINAILTSARRQDSEREAAAGRAKDQGSGRLGTEWHGLAGGRRRKRRRERTD